MELLRAYVTDSLKKNLSQSLKYHGLHHTLDVVNSSLHLAQLEGITDPKELLLLETAAWFHDIGFISTFYGHEEESCKIAEQVLPNFGYSNSEISIIKNLIMATKIPQNPKNLLEKILADADLDYLGRDDFEKISETLFMELKEKMIVQDLFEWNKIQIRFLSAHKYWTKSASKLRESKKNERLKFLMANNQ
jgi:uncharacterized protein